MTKENLGTGFIELTQEEMDGIGGGSGLYNLFGSGVALGGGMVALATPAAPVAVGYFICAAAGALGGVAVAEMKGWIKP